MNLDALIPQLESTFATAARASLGAGFLILAGACLFFLFPKLFGPRWRFFFGVVILSRLLLPFSPESRLSVFNLWRHESDTPHFENSGPPAVKFTRNEPASEISDFAYRSPPAIELIDTHPESIPTLALAAPLSAEHFASAPDPNPAESPWPAGALVALPFLWLAGAAMIFGWALSRNIRLAGLLRRQGSPVEDERLLRLLAQSAKALGIPRAIPLTTAPRLQCAAVFGWLRPRLLISEDFAARFSDSEIRGIFLHELAHVRRHDVMWNWLAHLALAIHWFNPLAWFAVRRFRADREQICDAIVLDRLSPRQRRDYGATLIALVAKIPGPSEAPVSVPALSPILTRKSELKNRIAMINRKKKPAHWALHGFAAVMLAVAGAVTFTSAIADDEKDERRGGEPERKVERGADREKPESRGREEDRDRPEARGHRDEDRKQEVRRGEGRAEAETPEGRRDGAVTRERETHSIRREVKREHDDDDERGHHDRDPEAREFIGTIQELKEKIHELARVGKREEAHQLEEKVHEMLREHPEKAEQFHAQQRRRENMEIEGEMKKLTVALKGALEEGRAEQAREIRKQMEEIHHAVRRRDEGEHAERRIHHLHQAAENLEAAGLHEQAGDLREQAKRIEQELRHHHAEGRDHDLARHAEHLEREVAELKEIVGNLREQVENLQTQLRQSRGERD